MLRDRELFEDLMEAIKPKIIICLGSAKKAEKAAAKAEKKTAKTAKKTK